MFLQSLHVFSVPSSPGESFPRMTGAKGPKASEDTDAAAAEVEQTPVDDTDPRLGNV